MKSTKVTLYEWKYSTDIASELDIDWPMVQRSLGEDCLRWLLNQPHDQCQLILEKTHDADTLDDKHRLIAEFYDEKVAVSYHLMWAK